MLVFNAQPTGTVISRRQKGRRRRRKMMTKIVLVAMIMMMAMIMMLIIMTIDDNNDYNNVVSDRNDDGDIDKTLYDLPTYPHFCSSQNKATLLNIQFFFQKEITKNLILCSSNGP